MTAITTIDRIPPHNLDAERAVIGSALVDREIMAIVSELVQQTDFYAHVHESIFAVLTMLFEKGEPLDKITVAEALRSRDQLEKVGGIPYLSSLMDTVQTAGSASYYAKIVRQKAVLRGLIAAGTQITSLGYESEEDVDSAVDAAEQIALAVDDRNNPNHSTPMFEVLKQTFRALGDETQRGLTTGFPSIDSFTTGLRPGNFWIIAARPGMGKTAIGLQMAGAAAKEAAANDEGPVWFISLEMTTEELGYRFISNTARIDLNSMRKKTLTSHDWEKVSIAMADLAKLPVIIDDVGTLAVSQVRARARRMKAGRGLSAIFIDYVQLLQPSVRVRGERNPGNRNEEVADVCRMLKATAKDLRIPIVALAQINRGVENRDDKRPRLADLRDSGQLEQDADLVAFLYREGYYDKECADRDAAEFIVAKQRNGPTDTLPLHFEATFTRYSDATTLRSV